MPLCGSDLRVGESQSLHTVNIQQGETEGHGQDSALLGQQKAHHRPDQKKDAGAYQCEVSNTFISRLSDPFSLAILCE